MVRAAQSRRCRLLAIQARTTPASVPCRLANADDGREVALEVAAGDAEAGREIGVLADALVELQRRHDLGPVGADRSHSSASVLATLIDATRQQLMAILASSALS